MRKPRYSPYDDSRFSGSLELSHEQKISGQYRIEDAVFRYSVSPQKPTAKYAYRGRVSMLDTTGYVLRDRNDTPLSLPFQLTVDDKDSLKKMIADKSLSLYHQYGGQKLIADGARLLPIEEICFGLLVNLYGAQYAAAVSPCSEEAQKRRIASLERIAIVLETKCVKDISQRVLDEFCKAGGGNRYNDIREAAQFLSYAVREVQDITENPFEVYCKRHLPSRNTKALQRKAASTDTLSDSEVLIINKTILESIDDGYTAAVGILKETGLSAAEVCALHFSDVKPYEKDGLVISLETDNADIVPFVCTSLCCTIIGRRKMLLKEAGYTDEEISGMYIVHEMSDPLSPLNRSVLVQKCRYMLRNCGVSYAKLANINDAGGGINLLRSNRKVCLAEKCRLSNDIGMLNHLMHQSLSGSVQSEYYRCFTDPTAFHAQYVAQRRERLPDEAKAPAPIRVKESPNGSRLCFPPANSAYQNKVCIRVRLKKGDTVSISSDYGCHIALREVSEEPPPPTPLQKQN